MKFKTLTALIALTLVFSGCNEDSTAVDELSLTNETIESPLLTPDDPEVTQNFFIELAPEDVQEEESSDEIIADDEASQLLLDLIGSIEQPNDAPPAEEEEEEQASNDTPPAEEEEEEQASNDTPPAEEEEEEEEQASNDTPVEEDIIEIETEEDEQSDVACRKNGNLIVNGSFEASDAREGLRNIALDSIVSKKWDVFQSLPSEVENKDSWYTSAGPGIEIQGDKTVVSAAHGNRVVELDSHGAQDTNSTMSQDVLLCRGKHILKFMYYPRTKNAQDNIIEVRIGDRVIKTVDMVNNGSWVRIRAPFRVKEKKSFKISFTAKGSDNSLGGLIDHVRLHKKKRRAGVVTSLLSLGDRDNIPSPLIRNEIATAIIRKAVNFASIKKSPKVLMLKDNFHGGESLDDFTLTESILKEVYGAGNISVKSGEVRSADVVGYDVIYIVNPGHPMGSAVTADTLREAKAQGNVGIVIHGDDMARGRNFALTDLTGLKYKNNGTSACGIRIDNNQSKKYSVQLSKRFFKGLSQESRIMSYGNDIDHTEIVNKKIRVLATAKAPEGCDLSLPTIVGYKLDRNQQNSSDQTNNTAQ